MAGRARNDLPAAVLVLACAAAQAADPASVSLQGMMGSKALIIVGGSAPRMMAPGETYQGVKVLSTSGDQAVVEIEGQRHTLRVGEAPGSWGGSAGGARRIVLPVDRGGHFTAQGTINGKPATFMVDTGATSIAMSVADAERMGINFRGGRQVLVGTANGATAGWVVKLASVKIAEVEVYDVDAVVSAPSMPYVLLGNSYLNRFQMKRDSEQMVLERRY